MEVKGEMKHRVVSESLVLNSILYMMPGWWNVLGLLRSRQVHGRAQVRFHGLLALPHQITHELVHTPAPAVATMRRLRTLSAASTCLRVLLHVLLSEVDGLVQTCDGVLTFVWGTCFALQATSPCPPHRWVYSTGNYGLPRSEHETTSCLN